MTVLSAESIENYLTDYGWDYSVQKNNTWVSGWEGTVGSYPLEIELKDTIVSFVVKPLTDDITTFDESPELLEDILRFNHNLKLVRLSLSESGDLCLCYDVFQENLDFDGFSSALGVLGYYCDILTKEIAELIDFHGVESHRPTFS
jgi:hypothetical protein